MAMIYELQAVQHYGYKIFATVDAAERYLGISISAEDFELNAI